MKNNKTMPAFRIDDFKDFPDMIESDREVQPQSYLWSSCEYSGAHDVFYHGTRIKPAPLTAFDLEG